MNWDGNEERTRGAVLTVNTGLDASTDAQMCKDGFPVMDLIIPNDTAWTPLRITAAEEHK